VHLSQRDLWEVRTYNYSLRLGKERVVSEVGLTLLATHVPLRALPTGAPPHRNLAWLDADASAGEMTVRSIRPGDRFRPLGLKGEKKIKDFFTDERIPRSLRARIAILEIGGRVGWVIGHRIDDRFKVSERTRLVLQIEGMPQEKQGNLR
jgi:tRNA(Ile)-lysidine synthase